MTRAPRSRRWLAGLATLATLVGAAASSFVAPSPVAAGTPPARLPYVYLEGSEADGFSPPSDEDVLNTWTLFGSDVSVTRYQQYTIGPAPDYAHIPVEDAQLSVVTKAGATVLVLGRYSGSVTLTAQPTVSPKQAATIAANATAAAASSTNSADPSSVVSAASLVARQVDLRVNPDNGRPFYLVESYAPGTRVFHEIDAATGAILTSWNGIDNAFGDGTGVKGDTKSLAAGS